MNEKETIKFLEEKVLYLVETLVAFVDEVEIELNKLEQRITFLEKDLKWFPSYD